MITIENLCYQYPGSFNRVLEDIHLSIDKGALLGLIGPNGAGKTTLISLLNGILQHKHGEITIGGYRLPQAVKQVKNLIGYVPQDYAFYPNLTAFENLQFFAGIQGLIRSEKQTRIDHCIDFCQLQNVVSQKSVEFSGGLKRRLNIAIGLLTDPEIIFFDEPTVSIDPQSRAFILQQIKALQERGKTIIYTSHYMGEIEQLCDYLAIIDHGMLIKQGTLNSLLQEQNRLVIDFETTIDSSSIIELQNSFSVSTHCKQCVFRDVVDMAAFDNVINSIRKLNLPISSIHYGKNSLEQVFLDLTNKELRD
jgi:ABC-2 type transport system ATP-binding protein